MSARDRIAPTRASLLGARRRLARVLKGASLTRRKREALVAELFKLARPAVDVRQQLADSANAAAEALAGALAAHGISGLTAMAWPTGDPRVEVRPAQIWGLAVSDVIQRPALQRTLDARGLAPGDVGMAVEEAARRYEIFAELLIEAAPREQRVRRLSDAVATTSRRLRTLEQRVAPALQTQIVSVRRDLDEREREERLRLQRLAAKRRAR
ncbi:MAG TPA: V-type ATP synthase subunit D [Gemmatimonadaceae bacterium]|nr:V-type ATP synthase subunit D [Gemmatimonadaceae bacterium]